MDIVPALTGMRIGIQLAVDALAARDDAKVKSALGELSQRLADANMGALAMSETLRRLEAEIHEATSKLRAAEERLQKRDRYVLREIGSGSFAYAYDAVPGDNTPSHYQCQICFDAGIYSVLSKGGAEGKYLGCRVDPQHTIQSAPLTPFSPMAIRRR